MALCFIGLGSNIGDRHKYITSAIDRIKKLPKTKVIKTSSLYETEPIGPPQGKYINCVARIETELRPIVLLDILHSIETVLGRRRREKWGIRTIDLDILTYDDLIINKRDLKVPHPLMHKRTFVLKGFSEIAPEFVHPVEKKTIKKLFEKLKSQTSKKG